MKKELLYSGKAKDIFSTDDEDLIVSVYKDQATMLNGARKEIIKGKGSLANQISSLIFEKLNRAGVATHFVKHLSEKEQLNRKVTVIPLEVVLRNVAAGSFAKRFGIEEGQKLEQPIIEFYYKNDDLDDPLINEDHIGVLHLATAEEITYIKAETQRINLLLQDWFSQIGLCLVDFKLEFGKDKNGQIILVDEFSPDNCRLWDSQGNHLDKDVFRRDLGSLTDAYSLVLKKLEEIH
ncbi:phosphoribosylaminoimidazolesuccinocarboxamide synthase [Streptococcus minor]|uniref:Phosphoribosylaminoimidazole-succinocarboxamide synthase n=1 Tax=Streptococcus minor TaxID=229549 RepID=A0A3P1V8A5_9STRE|nr:phosphoribosylaminoimidazolesuccinocarboxamide synthase [Streptococcus minor]MDO5079112.1 phosphoribosylaminoimidazolesuccinocarboxamide synthase [Streptococcus minor]RRD30028.1 phosphoribosylaminoimidazolesuccinocarboxamide synthase [Streptococcus minor]